MVDIDNFYSTSCDFIQYWDENKFILLPPHYEIWAARVGIDKGNGYLMEVSE